MKSKIINLTLRMSALFIRLLFLLYLGRYTTEYVLGEYSLFATTIALGLVVLGFDLYVNGTREVIAHSKNNHPQIIYNQFISIILAYSVFLPLFFIVFFKNIISWDFIIIFYFLLISEHIGSELYRLFIATEKPILANFLFIIRNALWGLILILLKFTEIIELTLIIIIKAWLITSIFSLLIGLYFLFKEYSFKNTKVDYKYIIKSYKTASKFFIGTLSYKIVEYSDRYFVDFFLGKEMVGIYSLYAQFGNVLNTAIYTVVITLSYPTIFKSINKKDESLLKLTKKRMLIEIIVLSLLTLIGGFFFLDLILQILNKSSFTEYKLLFYLFLFANTVFNISYIYHFIITGYRKDNFIMFITIIGSFIDIVLNYLLIPVYNLWGAVFAKVVAFSFIFVAKFIFVKVNLNE